MPELLKTAEAVAVVGLPGNQEKAGALRRLSMLD
jgi:hypothetical protein